MLRKTRTLKERKHGKYRKMKAGKYRNNLNNEKYRTIESRSMEIVKRVYGLVPDDREQIYGNSEGVTWGLVPDDREQIYGNSEGVTWG